RADSGVDGVTGVPGVAGIDIDLWYTLLLLTVATSPCSPATSLMIKGEGLVVSFLSLPRPRSGEGPATTSS
ncbi:hypothetical protein, partial [Latilactobacillus sakei]|uniref:hypothetical protein n=1 Tax=Latilactobacillus sakei TaxID=1599 RepID=UPI003F53B404